MPCFSQQKYYFPRRAASSRDAIAIAIYVYRRGNSDVTNCTRRRIARDKYPRAPLVTRSPLNFISPAVQHPARAEHARFLGSARVFRVFARVTLSLQK